MLVYIKRVGIAETAERAQHGDISTHICTFLSMVMWIQDPVPEPSPDLPINYRVCHNPCQVLLIAERVALDRVVFQKFILDSDMLLACA